MAAVPAPADAFPNSRHASRTRLMCRTRLSRCSSGVIGCLSLLVLPKPQAGRLQAEAEGASKRAASSFGQRQFDERFSPSYSARPVKRTNFVSGGKNDHSTASIPLWISSK